MWHVACTSGDMKRDSEKRRGAPNTCLLTSWVKLSQSASRSLMGMLASLPPGSDELEPTLECSSKSRASSSAARAGDVPESRLMISIVYMGLGLLLESTCENTSSQSLVCHSTSSSWSISTFAGRASTFEAILTAGAIGGVVGSAAFTM